MSATKINNQVELATRYEDGESMNGLAKSFGVSRSAVEQTLVKHYWKTYMPFVMDMLYHGRMSPEGRYGLALFCNVETMGVRLPRLMVMQVLSFKSDISRLKPGKQAEAMRQAYEQHFDDYKIYKCLSSFAKYIMIYEGDPFRWHNRHLIADQICRAPIKEIMDLVGLHYEEFRKMIRMYVIDYHKDLLEKRGDLSEILMRPINFARLSTRTTNGLENQLIWSHADLLETTDAEFLKFRNIGKTSLLEIHSYCELMGIPRSPSKWSVSQSAPITERKEELLERHQAICWLASNNNGEKLDKLTANFYKKWLDEIEAEIDRQTPTEN